jgi:hypothetical protein
MAAMNSNTARRGATPRPMAEPIAALWYPSAEPRLAEVCRWLDQVVRYVLWDVLKARSDEQGNDIDWAGASAAVERAGAGTDFGRSSGAGGEAGRRCTAV